ncbi:MAG: hypothetical protein ACOZIN_05620 [Myxococcota bacterium]
MTPETFQGGRRPLWGFSAAGVAGLLVTSIGFAFSPRKVLPSYLVAFVYWAGVAVAALILLSIFHASRGRWMVVLRRPLETMAESCALMVPLFLPIALGMKELYIWVAPPPELGEHTLRLLELKRPWLNVPFFLVRAAVYFAVWVGVGWALSRWSRQQDRAPGDFWLTAKQHRLGAGALPVLAVTLTFAAFDWLMSLRPEWYSTLFGVYYFAGSVLAVFALLALVVVLGRTAPLPGAQVTSAHLHSLGKFLLAFVAFWAYVAYSQFLLMWIANLPEEVPWYLERTTGGWQLVAVALGLGHFVLPFLALLSAKLKVRPALLGLAAGWLLWAHYLDLYWLVMPTLRGPVASPAWSDFTAFVGVGALTVAFGIWRLRGAYAVPVGDPFLEESLRYRPS